MQIAFLELEKREVNVDICETNFRYSDPQKKYQGLDKPSSQWSYEDICASIKSEDRYVADAVRELKLRGGSITKCLTGDSVKSSITSNNEVKFNQKRCERLGLKPGTPDYALCINSAK